MRLIDADETIKKLWLGNSDSIVLRGYAVEFVKKQPTIKAEPVRHGRWIMRGGYFRCSECDAKALWERKGGTGGWSSEFEQAEAPRCHICGAKMDKGEE